VSKNLKTTIVGVIIAVVVGLAVNYGLISRQTGDEIKARTDEALTNETAQPAPDEPPTVPQESPEETGQDAEPAPEQPVADTSQDPAEIQPAN
jgi:cell division protein FtsN